ncbi:MAG: hypothetical protein M1834_005649 [Cirrosporium novae-zelandiae]|nr:MAG: hypothetical protein M1834_005649 [Cirrosporium novae-zelandiae]
MSVTNNIDTTMAELQLKTKLDKADPSIDDSIANLSNAPFENRVSNCNEPTNESTRTNSNDPKTKQAEDSKAKSEETTIPEESHYDNANNLIKYLPTSPPQWLPKTAPLNHPHLVDLANFPHPSTFTSTITPNLLLPDAVATMLYTWNPECLRAFLQLQPDSNFEFVRLEKERREQEQKRSYVVARRGRKDVLVGTFSTDGYNGLDIIPNMEWHLLIKCTIEDDGVWVPETSLDFDLGGEGAAVDNANANANTTSVHSVNVHNLNWWSWFRKYNNTNNNADNANTNSENINKAKIPESPRMVQDRANWLARDLLIGMKWSNTAAAVDDATITYTVR